MDCFQHPGREASANCISCGNAICAECRQEVAGHPMCPPCVVNAQERLARETLPGAPQEVAGGTGAAAVAAQAAPLEPAGPAQYALAVVLGLVAAVVGAVIWDKFVIITNIKFGLIAVAVGALVGIAVRTGAGGRSGAAFPIIGAVLALLGMLLGNTLIFYDELGQHMAPAGATPIPLMQAIPVIMPGVVRGLGLMDWVFIAIGVYEGWIIPRRASESAAPAVTGTP